MTVSVITYEINKNTLNIKKIISIIYIILMPNFEILENLKIHRF